MVVIASVSMRGGEIEIRTFGSVEHPDQKSLNVAKIEGSDHVHEEIGAAVPPCQLHPRLAFPIDCYRRRRRTIRRQQPQHFRLKLRNMGDAGQHRPPLNRTKTPERPALHHRLPAQQMGPDPLPEPG